MMVADVNEPMLRTSTDLERNRRLARCSTIDCADIRGLGPVRSHANNGEHYLPAGERAWASDNREGKGSWTELLTPSSCFSTLADTHSFERHSSQRYSSYMYAACCFRLPPHALLYLMVCCHPCGLPHRRRNGCQGTARTLLLLS